MDDYLIKMYARRRLNDLNDKQLETLEEDASILVRQAIEQSKGKPNTPETALAQSLLRRFPHLPQVKKEVRRQRVVKMPREHYEYCDAAIVARDAAEDRWLSVKEKLAMAEKADAEANALCREDAEPIDDIESRLAEARVVLANWRLQELAAYAELYAGAHTLGYLKPVQAHLREQRLDRLAQLIAIFADPTAGCTEPSVTEPTPPIGTVGKDDTDSAK